MEQEIQIPVEPEAESAAPDQQEPQTERVPTTQETLNALLNRRTGDFDVTINYEDLKYLKNSIADKIEWKGPNEAYLVIISMLSLDNMLAGMDPKQKQAPVKIKLPASVLESINFFLGKISGKGLLSAQRLFGLSMSFRQAMESIKKLDEEIEFYKNQISIESQKSEA